MYYAYLAFDKLEKNLEIDLKEWFFKKDRLYLSNQKIKTYWSQIGAATVQEYEFKSIAEASKMLKAKNNLWANYPITSFRRAELIQESTTKKSEFRYEFMESLSKKQWGLWGLLEPNKLFYTPTDIWTSPFPLNKKEMVEDKVNPPNRAYLKLWELFTFYEIKPQKKDIVIDLGSCPGGWTWVLSQFAKKVYSIDKSKIDDRFDKIKNIEFIKADIFKFDFSTIEKLDWLFCDVICYPEKIQEAIETWLQNNTAENYVVTVKFKDAPNANVIKALEKIPGSKLIHLYHNKNEITWIKTKFIESL